MLTVLTIFLATTTTTPTAAPQTVDCNSYPRLVTAAPPRVPENAQSDIGAGRVAVVEVTVAADGALSDAKIYASSGSAAADAAALAAVRASKYKPAMKGCRAVTDTALIDEVVRPNYDKRNCRVRYQDATVLKQAPMRFPAAAVGYVRHPAQAMVRIDLDDDGDVRNAQIVRSSGNMALDEATLNGARATIYAPKIVNCEPVAGQYLFRATFDPTH